MLKEKAGEKMLKRLKVVLVLGIFTFLLTACGAQIHTETSFAKDGSGKRTVVLAIAQKDEGKISGGFDNLEKILKQNAPLCMSVNRHLDTEADKMLFELTYNFADIEDMKEKTKQITGKEPIVEWETSNGAFVGEVNYYDETTAKELVQWAIEALQENNISGAVISQIYEEIENSVSFEGDIVWTGKGNAHFQVDTTPVLEDVSVYTTFGEDGEFTKQIKLGFSYEDYYSMNTDEGLAYLREFSDKFKVDETCNGYSVSLKSGEELETFLAKASDTLADSEIYTDLGISRPSANYYIDNQSENNLFSNILSVTEIYNFNKLLAGFRVSAKTIKDYVCIPERESYTKEIVHHTYALESNEYYNYIGEYDINDMYYMCFQGGSRATIKAVQVNLSIDENLGGTQTVKLTMDKNERVFTSNEVTEYYSTLGEKVQFEDGEDTVSIQFIRPFKMRKSASFTISRTKYIFTEDISLQKYYPEISCAADYTIKVDKAYRIDSFSFGEEKLSRKELKAHKDNVQWVYSAHVDSSQNLEITIMVSKTNIIFYGILGILILLFIGSGLFIYFTVREKKKKQQQEKIE